MASTHAGRAVRLLGAVIAIAGLGAGAAYATTVISSKSLEASVIQACKSNGNGGLRVVSNPADCHANETPISWNTAGPPGQPGAPGVSPTVTQLASGDVHCSAGGATITDAFGSTAYVCSGTPFDGTFTSPNGHFTLTVGDNGVEVHGPSSQKITLDATGITFKGLDLKLESGNDATLKAGTTLTVQGGVSTLVKGAILDLHASATASLAGDSSVDVNGGTQATISGGQVASLDSGQVVTINGSQQVALNAGGLCLPVARQGDAVGGGVITAGSAHVCAGP
jgi:hypothetical protein